MKHSFPLVNLKTIRKQMGMTQHEFGTMLGFENNNAKIPQSYYRKYEDGSLALSAEHAFQIIAKVNITLAQLLEK
jgi:transcriptional regulator with XRE-family HTH domain